MYLTKEELYAALGLVMQNIEKGGANVELTNAVCIAGDVRSSIGNQWNRPAEDAAVRVRDALKRAGLIPPTQPITTEQVTTRAAVDNFAAACPEVFPGAEALTEKEVLILKIAELMLHRGFVDTAARVLLSGARKLTKAQDAVLRHDLQELLRRADDLAAVTWPKTLATTSSAT